MSTPVHYRCKAEHESNQEYDVEFASYDAHAKAHFKIYQENWEELLPDGELNAPAYLRFTFQALENCLALPRYLRCRDAEARLSGNRSLFPPPIMALPWRKPKNAIYAGHDSGVLISVLVFEGDARLAIRTAYRCGHRYDTPFQRLLHLKRKVLRMTEGRHENHRLTSITKYTQASWAVRANGRD